MITQKEFQKLVETTFNSSKDQLLALRDASKIADLSFLGLVSKLGHFENQIYLAQYLEYLREVGLWFLEEPSREEEKTVIGLRYFKGKFLDIAMNTETTSSQFEQAFNTQKRKAAKEMYSLFQRIC